MLTLPHLLVAACVALNGECFVWCLRFRLRRPPPPSPAPPPPSPGQVVGLFVVVGILWWLIDLLRFGWWVLRNVIEWGLVPITQNAQGRWEHRKLRRHTARHARYYPTAGNVLTAAAAEHYPVRQLPPPPVQSPPALPAYPPQQVIALPAAPEPEPAPVLPEGLLKIGPTGDMSTVEQLPDGRYLVTPVGRVS